jgi:hypothetical protein
LKSSKDVKLEEKRPVAHTKNLD